jgi:dUTP pyrophosphatase
METITVKIKNNSHNPLPSYATAQAAGLDLMAFLENTIVLKPMQRELIATGLYIELPHNHEAQIRPRSGLAYKNGITVLNSPGTIDADYRGEIKVLLINLSDTNFEINNGDRIAQMVIAPIVQSTLQNIEVLSSTQRNEGGFGSTGKK